MEEAFSETIDRALDIAVEGRKGPVFLDIASSLFKKDIAVKDLNDDTTGGLDTKGLESTVKIGKKINDLLNSLPNSGSVVTKFFTGEKSLTDFGEGIKGYATSLIDVSELLAEKPINSDAMAGIKSVGDFMNLLA